ncbi:MAG: S8 family serine peptidase [Alphaproteobacteria bacterium]|nr:S8 family serine peptidase [Alphaproteobacteria bacterium]
MIKLKNLSKRIALFFFFFCFFENHSAEATKILIYEPKGFFGFFCTNTYSVNKNYSIGQKKVFEISSKGQTNHALDILSVYSSYNPESTEIDVLYQDEGLSPYFSKDNNYEIVCNNVKEFLKEKKYDIISCSFQSYADYDLPIFKAIMDTLIVTNTLFLMLAHNHNKPIEAAYQRFLEHEGGRNMLFVGACDEDGNKTSYSNYSSDLTRDHFVYTKGNFVRNNEEIEGTSLATPFLAAYAARLKKENPDLMVFDLKNMILDKAILIDSNDHTLGRGYILCE